MSKRSKKKKQQKGEGWTFPDISNTVSAGEMTGMIPANPQTHDEYGNYQDMHSMSIPKKKGNDLETE